MQTYVRSIHLCRASVIRVHERSKVHERCDGATLRLWAGSDCRGPWYEHECKTCVTSEILICQLYPFFFCLAFTARVEGTHGGFSAATASLLGTQPVSDTAFLVRPLFRSAHIFRTRSLYYSLSGRRNSWVVLITGEPRGYILSLSSACAAAHIPHHCTDITPYVRQCTSYATLWSVHCLRSRSLFLAAAAPMTKKDPFQLHPAFVTLFRNVSGWCLFYSILLLFFFFVCILLRERYWKLRESL